MFIYWDLTRNLCLPALAPNLYLPAKAYNFNYRSGAWIRICLIICSSSSGSSNISISSNFFGIDNTNNDISMPVLVN